MSKTTNYTKELIDKFKTKYKLSGSDFWELNRGGRELIIIKHNAVERIAMQEKMSWTLTIENFAPDVVVKCCATWKDNLIESFGECTAQNNKNSFPYAMAEKRAVDRCILKLLNAHAYIYSESEADSFAEPQKTAQERLIEKEKESIKNIIKKEKDNA